MPGSLHIAHESFHRTAEDEQGAASWQILDRSRIFYIPGIGVDLDIFNPARVTFEEAAALRASLNLSEHFVFLVLGELIPRKRPADVVTAFAQMDHRCRLLFAGEGPLQRDLKRISETLGVGDRVLFLGQRNDVPCLLKASNALILASQQEGLPRCVMEAMGMGIPVIGTRIRGTADLLACGAGLLFDPGDIEGLHQAMLKIRSRPDLAEGMRQIGRSAATRYDVRSVLAQHDRMYEQIMTGSFAQQEQEKLAC